MKILILAPLFLIGCTSVTIPEQKIVMEKEIHAMSRQEVITAIKDCQVVDLRPVLINARKRVGGKNIPAVIDVMCAPN